MVEFRVASEGFAGFITWKTGKDPVIDGREFVFVFESEGEGEELESEYERGGFASVQRMTVRCGKMRRNARNN